jgi:hypothetical protein
MPAKQGIVQGGMSFDKLRIIPFGRGVGDTGFT